MRYTRRKANQTQDVVLIVSERVFVVVWNDKKAHT
jgi:hypothetical protein